MKVSDRDAAVERVADRQADVRDLRIGERAPWDDELAQSLPPEKQRVADRHACGRVGRVRVPVLETDVARGVDSAIRRAQEVVDANAGHRIVLDAGRLEIHSLDVRQPPDAGEDRIDRDLAAIVAARHLGDDRATFRAHSCRLRVEPDLEAVARERIREQLCRIAFLFRQKERKILNDRRLRARDGKTPAPPRSRADHRRSRAGAAEGR